MVFVDDPDEVGKLCEVDKVNICLAEALDDPPCLVNGLNAHNGRVDGPGSLGSVDALAV